MNRKKYSQKNIEHSPYYIALGSTQTHSDLVTTNIYYIYITKNIRRSGNG